MSSESYIRTRIRNMEALHSQLMQELECERQQQVRIYQRMKEKADIIRSDIDAAKYISTKSNVAMKTMSAGLIEDYDPVDDKAIIHDNKSTIYNARPLPTASHTRETKDRKLTPIDWTSQLNFAINKNSDDYKKDKYTGDIATKLSKAILITPEDIKAYNEFVEYMNELINSTYLDYDNFCLLLESRYTQLLSSIKFYPENEDDDFFVYQALCQMSGATPGQVKQEELKILINQMIHKELERKKETYVFQNLKEVFTELNMTIGDEMALDGLSGHQVTVEGIDNCLVFMSADGDGILFETLAKASEAEQLSTNQKKMIEEKAEEICLIHREVNKRLEARGILVEVEFNEIKSADKMKKSYRHANKKPAKEKRKEFALGG